MGAAFPPANGFRADHGKRYRTSVTFYTSPSESERRLKKPFWEKPTPFSKSSKSLRKLAGADPAPETRTDFLT